MICPQWGSRVRELRGITHTFILISEVPLVCAETWPELRSAAVSVPTVTGFGLGNNYVVNWAGICNTYGDKRSGQELLLHLCSGFLDLVLRPRSNEAYFHTACSLIICCQVTLPGDTSSTCWSCPSLGKLKHQLRCLSSLEHPGEPVLQALSYT